MKLLNETNEIICSSELAAEQLAEEQARCDNWKSCSVSSLEVKAFECIPILLSSDEYVADLRKTKNVAPTVTKDSLRECMESNCLSLHVPHENEFECYPIGTTAFGSLIQRAGYQNSPVLLSLTDKNSQKPMNPEKKSTVLNFGLSCYKNKALVLIRDEKIRAVLSGDEADYTILPFNQLFAAFKEGLSKQFEEVDYLVATASHEYLLVATAYLEKTESQGWDYAVEQEGMDYNLSAFAYHNNVDLFNKVTTITEEERQFLAVYLYPDNCLDDRMYYWNEIEPSLTDEDRKVIAGKYVDNPNSLNEIDRGISIFLSKVFLAKENPAEYKEYPYNRYLLADYRGDDNRAYLLFSDYVDAFLDLLKDLFGIKIGKQKIYPINNLDEYNDFYPIGDHEDLSYVEEVIIPLINAREIEIQDAVEEKVKKRLLGMYQNFNTTLLAQQFCIKAGTNIRGYGKKCPFLNADAVLEMKSLQTFKVPLFGLHVGITLMGSAEFMKFLTKYNTKTKVSIIKKNSNNRRKKRSEGTQEGFSYSEGVYCYAGGQPIRISGKDTVYNKGLVNNIIQYMVSQLQDVTTVLRIEVESYTINGERRFFKKDLELTLVHRVIMIHELKSALDKLELDTN